MFRILFLLALVTVYFSRVDCADCVDKDPAKCKNLKDMCFDAGYEDMLKDLCQMTCEYCVPAPTKAGEVVTKAPPATTKTAPATTQKPTAGPNPAVTTTMNPGVTTDSSCKDDPNTDCVRYSSLCTKSEYKDLLSSFCPKTCNFCSNTPTTTVKPTTDSSCKDDPNTDCTKYVSLCLKSEYKDLLNSFCPKTCNFCGSTLCEDKDHRCEAWAGNGYCTNPFYKPEDRVVCQKTCGMC